MAVRWRRLVWLSCTGTLQLYRDAPAIQGRLSWCLLVLANLHVLKELHPRNGIRGAISSASSGLGEFACGVTSHTNRYSPCRRCTPMRCMPMRCRPIYAYKVHASEMHAYEMHAYEIHVMRCMPMRSTPMRYTPTRSTPTGCMPEMHAHEMSP